jgi:hypothetical protein
MAVSFDLKVERMRAALRNKEVGLKNFIILFAKMCLMTRKSSGGSESLIYSRIC